MLGGLRGAAAAGLALIVAAGCATRTSTGLTGRLVTGGDGPAAAEATFDVGPAPGGVAAPAAPPAEARRVEPVPKFVAPNALEDRDTALGEALLALAAGESATAHRRVAGEYRRLKVFDRAEAHLTLALALEPRDATLLDARARVWRDWGLPARALADAHRAAFLAPDSAQAQNTLGTVLFALGQIGQARDRFARAIGMAPEAAHFRSNLCFAAYAQGALDAALSACDAALRLSPDLEVARRNRELVTAAMRAAADGVRTEGTP